jgi:hypothetical protein
LRRTPDGNRDELLVIALVRKRKTRFILDAHSETNEPIARIADDSAHALRGRFAFA